MAWHLQPNRGKVSPFYLHPLFPSPLLLIQSTATSTGWGMGEGRVKSGGQGPCVQVLGLADLPCLQRGVLSSGAGRSAGCQCPGRLPRDGYFMGGGESAGSAHLQTARVTCRPSCGLVVQGSIWLLSSALHWLGDTGQVLRLSVLDFYVKNWNGDNSPSSY